MTVSKRLLLVAPATLVAVATARAADLPVNKAAPVAYVRVCDAYGSGFFYIPGTDTCLRVGGYIRYEYRFTPGQSIYNVATGALSQSAHAQDETGMEARGRIDLDARTQTAWGTVQTVVHLRGANGDGLRAQSAINEFGLQATPGGNKSTSVTMERAFIRFAGLTAGVSSENFTILPSYFYGPKLSAGYPNGMKQFAYTATFGNGFSATFAIESKGDNGQTVVTAADGNINAVTPGATNVPYAYNVTYANRFASCYMLVGNIRYDAKWGFFQLMGAVTENSINAVTLGGGSTTGNSFYSPLDGAKNFGAFAAGFGLRYNLSFIAPGDQFHFQAAYEKGIANLIHSGGSLNTGSDSNGSFRWLGGVETYVNNIVATSAAGATVTSVGQTSGWQVDGVFTHYWSPTWRANAQAGYEEIYVPTAAASAGVQIGGAKMFDAGANLIWSPTKNFDIGVEIDYMHLKNSIQNPTVAFVRAGEPGLAPSNWMSTLRLERQF
jgi:hypothetical protein